MKLRAACKINLITGSLGSGKTTLIRHLLSLKPEHETWHVIVNEFGAIGIDQVILDSDAPSHVSQLTGGCICCTNQSELIEILTTLREYQNIDRIIIEPTGIGEPDVMVDLINSLPTSLPYQIESIYSVFDLTQISPAQFQEYSFMNNLLLAADIIVFNKQDLASAEQMSAMQDYCHQLYPPKHHIFFTSNGEVPLDSINVGKPKPFQAFSRPIQTTHQACEKPINYVTTDMPELVHRAHQTSAEFATLGWIFADSARFDWKALKALIEDIAAEHPQDLLRAKGVFRIGKPTMLFQYVHQQLKREYIAYRRDSRFELILSTQHQIDLADVEQRLSNSILR